MKICILGAGSLGSVFGGMLAASGEEVYLINHRREYIDNVNKNGIVLKTGDLERSIPVRAMQNCNGLGIMDLVIVLVKSAATTDAVKSAMNIIGNNTMVLSLQNGLGNEERIGQIVGTERLIWGRTYAGGLMYASGKAVASTEGKKTLLGEANGAVTERIKEIVTIFNKSGLDTEVSSNIQGVAWDKLLVNASTGAVCTIAEMVYGDMYAFDELKPTVFAGVEEGIRVADKLGIRLSCNDANEIWQRAGRGLPYDFKPSMLQSFERKQKSEIDFINGAIVTYGDKVGVATPINKALVALVKAKELKL